METTQNFEREATFQADRFGPNEWFDHLKKYFGADLETFHMFRKQLIRYKIGDPTLFNHLSEEMLKDIQEWYDSIFMEARQAWKNPPAGLVITEQLLQKYGSNCAGRSGCDSLDSPCSCGAWHRPFKDLNLMGVKKSEAA